MTELFATIAFYLFALATIVGALGTVLARRIFHNALLLVVALSSVAAIYVLLSADFLAAVQVLVYTGAIVILMLFAIMLTPNQLDLPGGSPQAQRISAALTSLAVGALSIGVMVSHPWNLRPQPLNMETAATIGNLLLTTYVLPFWIASVLLTVGLVGAIVIAREE